MKKTTDKENNENLLTDLEINKTEIAEESNLKEFDDDENLHEEELREQVEIYEEIQEGDRRQKVILVIIIIFLLFILLFCIVGVKLGKIGYYDTYSSIVQTGGNVTQVDSSKLIEVNDDDVEIIQNTKIDIFENEIFKHKDLIAPRTKGTYNFSIKNVSNKDITYDIIFADEMDLPVNMKYKLKIDNVYIRGNKKEYVNIKNLDVKDIIVLKDSINLFTLEWYWEDDDRNDTIVGSQKEDQHYILNLDIYASEYIK